MKALLFHFVCAVLVYATFMFFRGPGILALSAIACVILANCSRIQIGRHTQERLWKWAVLPSMAASLIGLIICAPLTGEAWLWRLAQWLSDQVLVDAPLDRIIRFLIGTPGSLSEQGVTQMSRLSEIGRRLYLALYGAYILGGVGFAVSFPWMVRLARTASLVIPRAEGHRRAGKLAIAAGAMVMVALSALFWLLDGASLPRLLGNSLTQPAIVTILLWPWSGVTLVVGVAALRYFRLQDGPNYEAPSP